jgi:copper(I)-binding protein
VIRSGWRSRLPRRLVLVAAAALIPVLAGCEAGTNAPTINFHYPTDAAGTVTGDISIRNVFVLGPGLGTNLRAGQSASLFMALVNTGAPDRLLSISAPGTATSVSIPSGGVPVLTNDPVLLNGPKPVLVLVHLTRTVLSGSSLKLVLTFRNAGTITLQVPVFPRALHYQTLSPPPAPTPSATVTATGKKGKHHKANASASPTPSASVTPTPTPTPTS